MKKLLVSTIGLLFLSSALAANAGVSLVVGEPGYYGRIDIGSFPKPRLVYGKPVVVERIYVESAPVYFHVPPGHARHWDKHCHEYRACGDRVYFVEESWYEQVYVPEYRKSHGNKGKKKKPKQ